VPYKYLIPASVVVSLVNTSLVMPFDCVKTHMEKINPKTNYIAAFKEIYGSAGFLGFFTGVRLRMILGFTNTLFVVNILEFLEHISLRIN